MEILLLVDLLQGSVCCPQPRLSHTSHDKIARLCSLKGTIQRAIQPHFSIAVSSLVAETIPNFNLCISHCYAKLTHINNKIHLTFYNRNPIEKDC